MRRAALAGQAVVALWCLAGVASAQMAYSGAVSVVRSRTATETADAVYLFNSIDVAHGRFRATATLPVIWYRATPLATPVAGSSAGSGGVGDPMLRVDVTLMGRRWSRFSTAVSAAVKLPVADVDSGIGTGSVDAAFGVTVIAGRGARSVLVDVSYWVLGDPPGIPQRNIPSIYVGYATALGSGYRWSAFAALASSASIVPGLSPPTHFSLGVMRALRSGAGMGVTAGFGMTDTASDFSFGANWRKTF